MERTSPRSARAPCHRELVSAVVVSAVISGLCAAENVLSWGHRTLQHSLRVVLD